MKQTPKFLWDVGYLREQREVLGDKCIFLCLSPLSFKLLADMSRMLLWATRYSSEDVPDLGRVAYRELNTMCDIKQLITDTVGGEYDSRFESVINMLKELEEMNVTQTVTVTGCGSGGGTATSETISNGGDFPIVDTEDTGEVGEYSTETMEYADVDKCRAANYLAVKVVSTLRFLANMGAGAATVAGIVTLIVTAVAWLTPIPGDEVLSTSALMYYAFIFANGLRTGSFALGVFDDLALILESDLKGFVCSLYDWDTAEELGGTLAQEIESGLSDLVDNTGLEGEGAATVKKILDWLLGSSVINFFVENVETIVPSEFVASYSCRCGASGGSCPSSNIVLAGIGTLPGGDLSGTTQGFASEFDSGEGVHVVKLEMAQNYCIEVESGQYTPTVHLSACIDGVMQLSDGCARRVVAVSASPFALSVEFLGISEGCDCESFDCLVPEGIIVPGKIDEVVRQQPDCVNYTVDSVTMTGNRLTAEFSVGHSPCWADGFTLTFLPLVDVPVGYKVSAYLLKDVTLDGRLGAGFEGQELSDVPRDYYDTSQWDWRSCLEADGYLKLASDTFGEYDFMVARRSEDEGFDSYLLTMEIKVILSEI